MNEDVLKEIASTLKQILKWSRFAGMQQLRTALAMNLATDEEMLVYELSDGTNGTREVASLAHLGSNATVARYWKKWSKIGIVEPSQKFQGRYQRICSLEEVGITIPSVAKRGPRENLEQKEQDQNG